MEAIDITYNDWQDIIKIFMGQLLQSSGIARSAPRDLIFSDKQYNGLGINIHTIPKLSSTYKQS